MLRRRVAVIRARGERGRTRQLDIDQTTCWGVTVTQRSATRPATLSKCSNEQSENRCQAPHAAWYVYTELHQTKTSKKRLTWTQLFWQLLVIPCLWLMRYYIALNVTVFIKRYSTPVNGKKKYKPQDNRLMSLSMFSLIPVLKQTESNIIHCIIFSSKKHYTKCSIVLLPVWASRDDLQTFLHLADNKNCNTVISRHRQNKHLMGGNNFCKTISLWFCRMSFLTCCARKYFHVCCLTNRQHNAPQSS